jgi:hypothetical protein
MSHTSRELALEEMSADLIVQLVMSRDNIVAVDVRGHQARGVRRHLRWNSALALSKPLDAEDGCHAQLNKKR